MSQGEDLKEDLKELIEKDLPQIDTILANKIIDLSHEHVHKFINYWGYKRAINDPINFEKVDLTIIEKERLRNFAKIILNLKSLKETGNIDRKTVLDTACIIEFIFKYYELVKNEIMKYYRLLDFRYQDEIVIKELQINAINNFCEKLRKILRDQLSCITRGYEKLKIEITPEEKVKLKKIEEKLEIKYFENLLQQATQFYYEKLLLDILKTKEIKADKFPEYYGKIKKWFNGYITENPELVQQVETELRKHQRKYLRRKQIREIFDNYVNLALERYDKFFKALSITEKDIENEAEAERIDHILSLREKEYFETYFSQFLTKIKEKNIKLSADKIKYYENLFYQFLENKAESSIDEKIKKERELQKISRENVPYIPERERHPSLAKLSSNSGWADGPSLTRGLAIGQSPSRRSSQEKKKVSVTFDPKLGDGPMARGELRSPLARNGKEEESITLESVINNPEFKAFYAELKKGKDDFSEIENPLREYLASIGIVKKNPEDIELQDEIIIYLKVDF